MADEVKHKGISLRRKKTTRPKISAPRPQLERDVSVSSFASTDKARNDSNNASRSPSQASGATPRPRPTRDNTADLVKRRYSTRFTGAGLPQDGGLLPPVPSLPPMPGQYSDFGGSNRAPSASPSRSVGRSPDRGRGAPGGPLKIDLSALQNPNLNPDQYVATALADASESDITAFQSDLQNVKAGASTDLQHNVYQNRTQFIKISKEADRLKSEMHTLRTLMGELTGALGHATSAGSGANNLLDTTDLASSGNDGRGGGAGQLLTVADRKRANRSSVANLEALWSTQLQTVWKRIEGSQKYLPALPGRHIILESQRWVELNSATWKVRRRIALVLLNDHLLVASEKKRNDLMTAQANSSPNNKRASVYMQQQSLQTSLVAERCWPLQDVRLADISADSITSAKGAKESAQLKNAVNIRAGTESFTYATNDSTEKASLVVAFRKAQEDLRKLVAAEHGERKKELDEISFLTGREPRALKKAAAAANALSNDKDLKSGNLGGLSRSNSVLVDQDGRQQSIRWVENQIDNLDINIALQRFEEAVAGMEELRKLARGIARQHAAAQDIILAKTNERASKLASSIARQLTQTSSGAGKTKTNVSWLLRLGHEELARSSYLTSRTETIRLRVRQLPFTGDLPPYLHALTFTTFTLLLHTFRVFSSSFPSTSGSAVVKWAKERVDEFNDMLGRQLSTVDPTSHLWAECVDIVREQAAVLSEVGVDFSGLVDKALQHGEEGRVRATNARENGVGLGVTT
ncbi:hypothetical protein K431DRAFT_285715 [Polychaeton citri CBS 116435]|uniref:Exocyst complex component EXO84 n=1 Tax=Polychaeton citri CBS 116435 TaxID=1314669 RepID=A0A9P4UQ25_9PEZI|nr:hypothetical protein K431DRAFT_285715 [Polychaeton citri CBS 116435]